LENKASRSTSTGSQPARLNLDPNCDSFDDCFFANIETTDGGATIHFKD
jgi:hypothetical protein